MGLGLVWSLTVLLGANARPEGGLFPGTNVLSVSIEIPEEGLDILRGSGRARGVGGKPEALVTVIEGGRRYANVVAQLKGYTSFQPVDQFPSLTLHFNKRVSGQKFHGYAKLSFNNSFQDPTFLHERLTREVYAAAGVPVPRSDFAMIQLNGRELGLYVVVEAFDKHFLKRHFERSDGTLFEPAALHDIDRPMRLDDGDPETGGAALRRLIRAAREPKLESRMAALEAAMDVERFLSMMAVEVMLCHSDSYSMNRNNYRLYHDPGTDKIVFLPHGMDRVLGAHRSSLDLPLIPTTLGLVARAVLSTQEGRRRYLERVDQLFRTVFDSDALCRWMREIEVEIQAGKGALPKERRWGERRRAGKTSDADRLCERIERRFGELRAQITHARELMAAVPLTPFDSDGVAFPQDWSLIRRADSTEAVLELQTKDGQRLWRIRGRAPNLKVVVVHRFRLSKGFYQLTGQPRFLGAEPSVVRAVLVRPWTERYGVEHQVLDWRKLNTIFEVTSAAASGEVDLHYEIEASGTEVLFDPSSIRLVRRVVR